METLEHAKTSGQDIFAKGQRLLYEGKFSEAEAILDDLLIQNHDSPGLLATIGTLMLKTDRLGLAISLLERASRNPDGYVSISDVLANLAIAYKQSGQYNKSKDVFEKAIKNNPTAKTVADYAAMFINVGEPEKAEKLAKQALRMDENSALAHYNLSIAELELGKWETAWEHAEWAFKTSPPMRIDRKIAGKPYWDGTPGKRLVVYGEQGLGDEIMFASILPDVMRENSVILESHQRLATLFRNSFPDLTIYGTREDTKISWPDDHEIDAQVSIGSLGKFYRRSRSAFPGTPYLKAEPAERGERFRVGISWTGGMKPGRVRTREVPLPWWGEILKNDCEFVSLQYTDCDDDIEAMRHVGHDIQAFDAVKAHDYNETARLVKSCDLVISVCTSVVHLAGALGVPCWCMTPNKPAWRYGVTGGCAWYRSVRLYRQPIGDSSMWRPVINRVAMDLSDVTGTRQRKTA